MNLSKRLRIYELETYETLPYDYKGKVRIPMTYVPVGSKDHDIRRYFTWRAFMGNRFVGEYSPYWYTGWKPVLSYVRRPKLSTLTINKVISSWHVLETKKVSRALNVLEHGSSRFGAKRLVKSIKEHCGIDARII